MSAAPTSSSARTVSPARTVGTGGVFIAGVALVVSASTFVSDFTGFLTLGLGFAVALLLGFIVILPAALAAADLTVCHPRAGGIYQFARRVIEGRAGRLAALFLSLCFFGTFLFGAAGETMAGAHAVRALLGGDAPVRWFVPIIVLPAIGANLCGLRCATRLTGALLALMLGVRWWFGVAGFCGWADTGPWLAANLMPAGGWSWGGESGILAAGVAFGFWSFVGIEGAAGLVEETRRPRRAVPLGMLLGLGAILVTTLVMGVGAIGTQPLSTWHEQVTVGAGEAPHLAIGAAMFGPIGEVLMAAASVAATWSTLLIALATVPRMIFAVARDGLFFGPLSPYFAQLHPRTGVPVRATVLVVAIHLAVTLSQGVVVDCLYAAAYLWFFRYLVIAILAATNRLRQPRVAGILPRRWLVGVATVGGVLILGAWYFGFAGTHALYGARALVVVAVALAGAALAWTLRARPGAAPLEDQPIPLRVRKPATTSLKSRHGSHAMPAAAAANVAARKRPIFASNHAAPAVQLGQLAGATAARS